MRVIHTKVVADLAYSPQSRAERLIAIGRVVLAVFSLLAIWLDPSELAPHSQLLYVLLAGYVVYSVVLASFAWWHLDVPLVRTRLLTHILDLVFFSLLMHLAEGFMSPFFVYFVFSLVCATLRWQLRGVLWTAIAALGVFIGMGIYVSQVLRDPDFELNRFLVSSGYLAVIAILLGYFGAYEERLRNELSKLAVWPRTISREVYTLVRDMLAHAADILDAPRVLMAWEEPEEPWLHLVSWSPSAFRWTRKLPTAFQPLVAEPLSMTNFLCPDVRAPMPTVLCTSSAGVQRWHGTPLHPEMQAQFAIDTVVAVNLRGESLTGRLFFLDKAQMTSDDLTIGVIAAREIVARMDQFFLSQRLQQAAATEERIRLARDLHDGLLQSLTGVSLQLETVHRMLEQDPQMAQKHLLDIQRLLTAEQRNLRLLIQDLKPAPFTSSERDFSLSIRLVELRQRIERHWGLHVDMHLEHLQVEPLGPLAHEIYRLVHEALINAARHAHAATARVELSVEDSQVHIVVADHGRGFPFHGRYDLATLTAMGLGPATLKERISSLGGSLIVDSTDSGTRLHMILPFARSGA